MSVIRLFVSSVQKEIFVERMSLRDDLRGDVLIRRFFGMLFFGEWLDLRLLNQLKTDEVMSRVGVLKGGFWEVLN